MHKISCSLLLMTCLCASSALAQNAYKQANLTSDLSGVAVHTDSQLVNPWGSAFFPGNPFWVADNNGGVSTLYDASGKKQSLVVPIATASVKPCSRACPTGIVANPTTSFGGSFFIFDTEDGIVAAWNGGTTATRVVDNSPSGAVYKGLAMIANLKGKFLLAANFHAATIDVFDSNFKSTTLAGRFHDPTLPAGYAPFGVHLVKGKVFVAYAKQNPSKHDAVIGPARGFVSVFDVNGNFLQRFASAGVLDAPWGVVQAPASGFGAFSGKLLIGNFGDGIINAFDPVTHARLGQIQNPDGTVIHNPGLWDMVFGAGGTGSPTTLFITVGILSEAHGLFAAISVSP